MAEESMLLIRAEPEILTNGLIDALMEAVVLPLDARARSAAIRCMLEEITTALEWLAGQDPPGDYATAAEVVSLRQLATAAQDHERRMMTLAAPAATGGRRTPGRRGRAADRAGRSHHV